MPVIRAVLATVVLAFASSVVVADTITVCPDGSCDYTDIQEAINAASDGDVIEIAAGTYYPAATIDTLGNAARFKVGFDCDRDGVKRASGWDTPDYESEKHSLRIPSSSFD